MLSIDRSVITDTGSALLNSGDPVNITSIKTGSGTYTSTEDIKSRTALKSTQYSYDPTSVQVDGVNRTVSGILTNYDPDTSQAIVTSDYTITEVGLFATVNSVEVLFAIGVSYDGTEVPAFTGQNKSEIIVDWVMALSGTAQVTVSSPGAYATAADLNTHIDNQVFSASGVHGIRAVDDDGVVKIQVYDDDWGDVNGGHVIVDESDTAYPYRSNLKFYNSTIVDNAADDTTEIHVEGAAIMVTPPTVVVGTYTYNGQPQGPTITWATGMEDYCIVTNATATDAGSYTLTIALKNTHKMFWSDMTTVDKTYSYTIAKQTLTVPTVTGSFTYDGTQKSATISGFDSSLMTKSGGTATNAGTYTVTFGLVDEDNYQWNTTPATGSWTIAKANQTITLSSSSVTLDSNNPTATVTVSGNQGSISASSSNTSKATVSVSGTTITISRVGFSGSSATVTVTVTAASTTNYNSVSATVAVSVVKNFKTMTVIIDQSNSNPATCCSYADDAVGMTAGSSAWDNFFGEVPVLLNSSGTELGNLKVSDYSKYENGTSAPITTVGNDVMVKFPKRGLKISTSGDTVTVSMTNDPNAESDGFKYYAHSYGANNNCDAVYVGAYKGYVSSSKLYSSSGKTPTGNLTIGEFRTRANARGTGYEQMTFYVRTFLIACYLLKYKNLDSQTAVGRGYVDGNSAPTTTGQTNTKGLDWGESTGKYQSKCLGIEDLWGNMHEWFDGIFSNSTRNILTATTNSSMNDTGSGYTDQGQGATADIGNYMSKVQGTTEKGFVTKSVSGSATTYFCDDGYLYASKLAYGGGYCRADDRAGVFDCNVSNSASDKTANIGGRLIKFKVAS